MGDPYVMTAISRGGHPVAGGRSLSGNGGMIMLRLFEADEDYVDDFDEDELEFEDEDLDDFEDFEEEEDFLEEDDEEF